MYIVCVSLHAYAYKKTEGCSSLVTKVMTATAEVHWGQKLGVAKGGVWGNTSTVTGIVRIK